MLDESWLKQFLNDKQINAEIIRFEKPVMKSEEAKKLVKGNIVKTILLIVDEKPLICLLRGEDRIDFSKIKRLKNAKEVRLAKAKEVKEITGYDIGALPPFAHLKQIETFIDKKVEDLGIVFCGGGSHYSLLKIDSKDLIKICKGKLVDIT